MVFTTESVIVIIIDVLLLFFGMIGFTLSLKIATYWNIDENTEAQYKLEKLNYLNSTIIKFVLYVKIILFVFFIFMLDELSNLIKGAMCAVGVIEGASSGNLLLVLKIVDIYLFAFWLLMDKIDLSSKNYRLTKMKSYFFIIIFTPFMAELILDFAVLSQIDIHRIASCCGVVFGTDASNLMSWLFSLSHTSVVLLFYVNFLIIILAYVFKRDFLFGFANFVFIPICIFSLILFFGTYIYELPTHHCPFCVLQKEYHYVGYFLYVFLFLGTFFGIASAFTKAANHKKYAVLFDLIYVLIISFYPLWFYFKNGVWL